MVTMLRKEKTAQAAKMLLTPIKEKVTMLLWVQQLFPNLME